MEQVSSRRATLGAALALAALAPAAIAASNPQPTGNPTMTQVTFTKMDPPAWLLAFWREIDDKTWGAGFDCFADDAVCNLGVADWRGKEAIRAKLRGFIDTGFTAHHDVLEYWDSPALKVFRGRVTMTPDGGGPAVHPTMTHFFYMDADAPGLVKRWYGAVGPVSFG